ncbi:MAG: CCA tRNA nucleotidyltransferase [Candidatus Melainabacteria bacterium]|jgi:tRNA nucleotidyltransferase (CCA-adding enzyme)|nr:CCA tRNA nucleotidyltransferase [Candidatus Melainabacteria bacterium]
MKTSSTIESLLQDIGSAAFALGHEIYLVGGYVRNQLMHDLRGKELKPCYDLDLVINCNAIEFTQKLQKYRQDNHPNHETFEVVEEFKQFGTVKIKDHNLPDYNIELASTRTETYDEPADFPKVTIIDSIKEDLQRRDFTINALLESINPPKAKHPSGEILDYVGGMSDIQKGLIRVFHKYSFIDDPTRIYRAARFAAEYDFEIEPQTLEWMQAAMKDPQYPEWLEKRKNRFAIEMGKIKQLKNAECALELLGCGN